ncbi:MAG: glycosyltransferase family 4 protein [Coriobacteriia bacterium]|nr:glycosyltransferase family 4 protein [Coriobacteriia bacterium]
MVVAMLVMNDMSFDQRVHREATSLGGAGYDVTVFCLRGQGLPDTEERPGYRVVRVADATTVGWSRPMTKIRQSRRRTRVLAQAAAATRPSVVHAHDTDCLPAGARVARWAGAKLVYDAHELFPDQFIGSKNVVSVLVRAWWRAVERRLVPRADAVITVSPGLAEVLAARFGVRVSVVRNVPPLAPLRRSARLRAELGIPEDVAIVLYQGLLLPERGLVELVESMARVDGAMLVIQGSGPEEGAMREAAERAGVVDRVRFMGWVRPADAHEYATGADIGVVTYGAETLNNRLAGPNKMFVYLMAGLPIAARGFPGPREIVLGERVGDVFDEATPACMAATLSRMLSDRDELGRAALRARAAAETKYNWERESASLLEVYARLVPEEASS